MKVDFSADSGDWRPLYLGPNEKRLQLERALFLQCVASPQRAGLVHAFFAEREVSKVPEARQAAVWELYRSTVEAVAARRSVSAWRKRVNSSGVLPRASAPSPSPSR